MTTHCNIDIVIPGNTPRSCFVECDYHKRSGSCEMRSFPSAITECPLRFRTDSDGSATESSCPQDVLQALLVVLYVQGRRS